MAKNKKAEEKVEIAALSVEDNPTANSPDNTVVSITATPAIAESGAYTDHDSGLPLPEGVEAPRENSAESALTAEDVPVDVPIMGVSDDDPVEQEPDAATVPEVHDEEEPDPAVVSEATKAVRVRGMRDLEFPPVVGSFDFHGTVGKEPRTNKLIRGKFKNGYVYVVPSYVASVLVEKRWALRI